MGVKVTSDLRSRRRIMNLTSNRCERNDQFLLSTSHTINTSLEQDRQPHAVRELFHRVTRISLPKVIDLQLKGARP